MTIMNELQQLFPSADGNQQQREELLKHFSSVLTKMDEIKDPSKLTLGAMPDYTEDFYNRIIQNAQVPHQGVPMEETIDKLMDLVKGHRFLNSNYVANATPQPRERAGANTYSFRSTAPHRHRLARSVKHHYLRLSASSFKAMQRLATT